MRAVKVLQDKGLLIKHMRRNSDDERHKSNVYEVVPPSSCQTPPNVSETPYKVTTDKTTKDIKRYSVTNNGGRVFEYYNLKYKERFNKEHPTVTMEQLSELENNLSFIMNKINVDEDRVLKHIDEHFKLLPASNDGKIHSFLATNGGYGVLKRYDDDYD